MTALLRIVTCGSVDDGKSTLIGRLLAETLSVPEDVLESARWTRRSGSIIPAGEVDFSLLTDGLEAEREQGITIDVAYRHLDLQNGVRAIIADAPGHEQYTRNMAVAASTADVGILLVDAARGVRTQTFRHLYICALMGVKTVVVAINKMDAIGFDQAIYDDLSAKVSASAQSVGLTNLITLPVSALAGDFVTMQSEAAPWYRGGTLLDVLRTVSASDLSGNSEFRMPVQVVLRAGGNYRGYAGTVLSGAVRVGDELTVGRTGVSAKVSGITVAGVEAASARAGQAIAISLDNEIDCARGDLFVQAGESRVPNDRYAVELVWLSEQPLARGRSYELVSGPLKVPATVTNIRDKVDVESGHRHASRDLQINEIGHVEIATDVPIVLDQYGTVRDTGSFLLVNRITGDSVAAGMMLHDMRRGANVHAQAFDADRGRRTTQMGHPSKVLWFTGLPGSGKSTIANAVEAELNTLGMHTYILDGDNIRLGLNKDLGFTPEDRAENVRRVGEVARLMQDAGLVVLVCLVSPYRDDRDAVRDRFSVGDFVEIHVDTPLEVCQARDPKGLYRQAEQGSLPNMTGVGQGYEAPLHAEVVVSGTGSVEEIARSIVAGVMS